MLDFLQANPRHTKVSIHAFSVGGYLLSEALVKVSNCFGQVPTQSLVRQVQIKERANNRDHPFLNRHVKLITETVFIQRPRKRLPTLTKLKADRPEATLPLNYSMQPCYATYAMYNRDVQRLHAKIAWESCSVSVHLQSSL